MTAAVLVGLAIAYAITAVSSARWLIRWRNNPASTIDWDTTEGMTEAAIGATALGLIWPLTHAALAARHWLVRP